MDNSNPPDILLIPTTPPYYQQQNQNEFTSIEVHTQSPTQPLPSNWYEIMTQSY